MKDDGRNENLKVLCRTRRNRLVLPLPILPTRAILTTCSSQAGVTVDDCLSAGRGLAALRRDGREPMKGRVVQGEYSRQRAGLIGIRS